ncbi:MAG: phage major capsid protein [Rubellimicrobium sp.]|nr:phage major capsid protein [Rubellimicrobium sp.]
MTNEPTNYQELYRHLKVMNTIAPQMKQAVEATRDHDRRLAELETQMSVAYRVATETRDQRNHAFVAGGHAAPHNGASARAEMDALAKYARAGIEIHNTISTAEPAEGGYTVTPVLADTLRAKLHDISAMARVVSNATLDQGNTWLQPINTTLAGATWVAEKDARNANTAPTFEQASISLDELASLVPITQRAIDDSFYDLGGFLTQNMGEQFARSIGDALLNGDGDKKPDGLLSYDTTDEPDGTRDWFKLQHINTEVAGEFGAAGADKLIDLAYALRAPYRPNARWMMTRATAAAIRKMKDEEGRYLWSEPLAEGQPPTLLGHPVELDEFMPEIGTNALAVAFGDFAQAYTMVTRPGLRLLRDPYTVKGSVLFYAYQRVGGGLINSEAVKFLRFGVTPGE